ncbi:MAG: hypothetical protein K0S05_2916, partial [Agromyces sp.]|nr:hypothetical protein [Agromyces sp.]
MAGAALYLFPSDLVDEGIETVLSTLRRWDATPALALAYHQARDVVPHAGDKPRL